MYICVFCISKCNDMNNTQSIFDPSLYDISVGSHKNKAVIWLRFPFDPSLVIALKSVTKGYWSRTQKSWYILDTNKNRELCNLEKKIIGKAAFEKISPENFIELEKYKNRLILKGFSYNTIKTYCNEFAQLLYALKNNPVQFLSKDKLQSYFLYCHKKLNLSENQIHSRMNAVKFYYEKVLHQEKMFFDIPRPKKPQLLPKFLNTEEIKKIFKVTENPKHKLILQLSYGMGLRVSEIVNLKIEDIDSVSKKVRIEKAKGKKDRYVNLPDSILTELRQYYKENRPKKYLFEGQNQEQYSIRSAQNVFRNAMQKAGIHKKIGIHGLRHSYATHLLEFGTDISLIQKLLGHNDIKTTLVYTNVSQKSISNVVSPLDRIK